MTEPNPVPQQVNIELPKELEAIYTNFAIINHSPSEIVIDFARLLPAVPTARIYARILMTPLNARLLLQALQENLAKFEAQYGEIRLPAQPGFQAPPGLFPEKSSDE